MHASPAAARARRGFTLIELLVALVLFDCALLALAGDAALLVRARGVAARREAGLAAALNTMTALRAQACGAPTAGQGAPAAGVREFWSTRLAPDSVRVLRDSIEFDGLARRSAFVLTSAVVC